MPRKVGEGVWAPNFYVVQGSIVFQAITKKQALGVERIRIGSKIKLDSILVFIIYCLCDLKHINKLLWISISLSTRYK